MSNEALGWVFNNSPYEGAKRVIHLAIADVVNDAYDNKFWMSNENLAAKARCTRQTVNVTLAEMVKAGYLEVSTEAKVGRGKTVEYRFIFRAEDPDEESVKFADTLESVKSADTSDGISVKSGDTLPPESVKSADTIPIVLTQVKEEPKDMSSKTKIDQIWDAYCDTLERCSLPSRKLTTSRKELIRNRLKEWTVDDLILAVTGLEFSDFHRGNNDNRKPYDSIELIIRDAKHIEQFQSYHNKKLVKNPKRVNDAWGREREVKRGTVINLDE